MTQHVQITKEMTVRIIEIEADTWFYLVDICAVIGNSCAGFQRALSSIFFRKEKLPNINGKIVGTVLVNKEGLRQILQRSRSINVEILLKGLSHFIQEPNKIVYACKEVSWLRIVKESFSQFESELQYPIGEYKIDLYFPKLQIAVECDENGHSDRSQEDEVIREKYIGMHLQCQMIRFNPDSPHFNIGTTINKLLRLILARNKIILGDLPPPPKSKRLLRDLTDKPCYTCKVVKPLEDFHKARENRDGRENICKVCREKRQEEIGKEKKGSLPENYTEKCCSVCKETKPLTDFFKDKQKWDGYALKCKVCWKSRNKELQENVKKDITEKTCTCCQTLKNITEFHKRKASPDGYSIYCKMCARNKAKEQYDKNHETILEKKRSYRLFRESQTAIKFQT